VRRSDFTTLFRRRPSTATVGLGIAAMSFLTTAITNLIILVSTGGFSFLVFDFVINYSQTSSDGTNPLNWRQALLAIIWSAAGLFACYMALPPRNIARFTVIAACGVKLFYYISYSSTTLSTVEYLILLLIAALPIILLLTKSSNSYYGRNQ
jgi:hypothetical protein